MKFEHPNIYWHGKKERILSIAFCPIGNMFLTAGTVDYETVDDEQNNTFIRQWEIHVEEKCGVKSDSIRYICDLFGHEKTVNCVRFSPNGKYLASCGDDNNIIIWNNKEANSWCVLKILKFHISDVYDLAWSRDSRYIVSGSIDNMAILWDIEKGQKVQLLEGHQHFVQGVSIDPRFEYIGTLSSDRSAIIWKHIKSNDGKICFNKNKVIKKLEYKNLPSQHDVNDKTKFPIFIDESSLNTFFRRLDWSPDGSLLLLPAGEYKKSIDSEIVTVVYAFKRNNLQNPCFIVPTCGNPALCVKFCPIIFKGDKLGYKMIFAIATTDSIIVYDTQSLEPVAMVHHIHDNIHFSSISDLSWQGARILGIGCSDGFCSFMIFDMNEFGEELPVEEYNEDLRSQLCMNKAM